MKRYLLIISLLSLTFTQELKVEGDLNVTGHIQNQTIDSLLQVIQSLQSQINSMNSGNKLETRVFELPRFEFDGQTSMNLDLSEITGFDLDYSILNIIHLTDYSTSSTNNTEILLRNQKFNHNGDTFWKYIQVSFYTNGGSVNPSENSLIYDSGILELFQTSGHIGFVDMILSVTSNFTTESQTQQSQTTSKQSK